MKLNNPLTEVKPCPSCGQMPVIANPETVMCCNEDCPLDVMVFANAVRDWNLLYDCIVNGVDTVSVKELIDPEGVYT